VSPPASEFPQKYPTPITTHWFAHHELARIAENFDHPGSRSISKMLIAERTRRSNIRATT
jgi:hypothetical protein